MARAESRVIAEFLRRRADDYLRSIVRYDDDGFALLYVRDDVSKRYTDDEIRDVIEDLRWQRFQKPHQEGLYVHGSLRCTVRCFDDAVEMHFLHDERSGTAIALEPEAAAELYTFVGDCLERLREG